MIQSDLPPPFLSGFVSFVTFVIGLTFSSVGFLKHFNIGTFPSADTSTPSSATIHKQPKFPPVLVLPVTSTSGQLLTSSVNLKQNQYNYILYNLKTKIQLIVLRCLTLKQKKKTTRKHS